MPLAADSPRGVVYASKFSDDGEDLEITCPYCGSELHFRNGSVTPHFAHSRFESCRTDIEFENDAPAGESKEHELMKFAAKEQLEKRFGENCTVELEYPIGNRRADVVAVFDDYFPPYGNGIVVEVQHKNDGKDYLSVTEDYIKNEFSIYWVFNSESDISELFSAKESLNAVFEKSIYIEQTDSPNESPELRSSNALTPETTLNENTAFHGTPISLLYQWKQQQSKHDSVHNIPSPLQTQFDDWLSKHKLRGRSLYKKKELKKVLLNCLPYYQSRLRFRNKSDHRRRINRHEQLEKFREVLIKESEYFREIIEDKINEVLERMDSSFDRDIQIYTNQSIPIDSIHGDIHVCFDNPHPVLGKSVIIDIRLFSPVVRSDVLKLIIQEHAYLPILMSDKLTEFIDNFEKNVQHVSQQVYKKSPDNIDIWNYHDVPLDKDEYDPLSPIRDRVRKNKKPRTVTLPLEWREEEFETVDFSSTIYPSSDHPIDPDSVHVECPHCHTFCPPNDWNYCPYCNREVEWKRVRASSPPKPQWLLKIPEPLHPENIVPWVKKKRTRWRDHPYVSTLAEETGCREEEIKRHLGVLSENGVIKGVEYGRVKLGDE